MRDEATFSGYPFACVIADEAQHIKNRQSQNARTLRSLQARGRFLLTGTPLENSLDDLRSLFEFLLPGCLERVPPGIRGAERDWHDQRLRAQTAPYLLRRTKGSVAPELPAKLEQIVWCEFSPGQAELYHGQSALGAAYMILGHIPEARERFECSLQLDHLSVRASRMLGFLLMLEGRGFEESISKAAGGSALAPNSLSLRM